jgi:hypothetical protein
MKPLRDRDRVFQYVENFFARQERPKFPTVRQVARALRWRQLRVEEAAYDDERLSLRCYNVSFEVPMGEYFVETYGEERP